MDTSFAKLCEEFNIKTTQLGRAVRELAKKINELEIPIDVKDDEPFYSYGFLDGSIWRNTWYILAIRDGKLGTLGNTSYSGVPDTFDELVDELEYFKKRRTKYQYYRYLKGLAQRLPVFLEHVKKKLEDANMEMTEAYEKINKMLKA